TVQPVAPHHLREDFDRPCLEKHPHRQMRPLILPVHPLPQRLDPHRQRLAAQRTRHHLIHNVSSRHPRAAPHPRKHHNQPTHHPTIDAAGRAQGAPRPLRLIIHHSRPTASPHPASG